MNINFFTLAREERVSDAVGLPYGRRVVAELEMLSILAAGPSPREPDTLQLIVESRASTDEPFAELARTRVLAEPGIATVELPVIEAPEVAPNPNDNSLFARLPPPPPTARVRLIHTGRLMPRFEVRLVGL